MENTIIKMTLPAIPTGSHIRNMITNFLLKMGEWNNLHVNYTYKNNAWQQDACKLVIPPV